MAVLTGELSAFGWAQIFAEVKLAWSLVQFPARSHLLVAGRCASCKVPPLGWTQTLGKKTHGDTTGDDASCAEHAVGCDGKKTGG